MVYEEIIDHLVTSTTLFVGNLVADIVAFCILALIMLVGIFVADILGKVLRHFFERIKIEKYLEKHGVHDAFVGFSFTNIVVALLKLYIAVAFFGIAADVVRIPIITFFYAQVSGYLPSLIQGIVILMAGLIAGDYITDRMKSSKNIPFANTVAIAVELFIIYNAVVIAMPMLLPAADPSFLVWSFLLVLAAAAFAIGLGSAIAIGLGMKDLAAEVARKHKHHLHRLL